MTNESLVNPRLLHLLACPLCRAPLRSLSGGYDWGATVCNSCRIFYPVISRIPRMLPYAVSLTEQFRTEHAAWIRKELPDYRLPAAAAPPGELDILRTFSREWSDYGWNEEAYWATNPQNLLASMRYALGTHRRALAGKVVLDVGMGVGGIASLLATSDGCEIVGMDLSYAVDQAGAAFRTNKSLYIVQGSLFFPPFPDATFDLVYSQGVLHHTYSTAAAFGSIVGLPRTGGWLYVWLYSSEQE